MTLSKKLMWFAYVLATLAGIYMILYSTQISASYTTIKDKLALTGSVALNYKMSEYPADNGITMATKYATTTPPESLQPYKIVYQYKLKAWVLLFSHLKVASEGGGKFYTLESANFSCPKKCLFTYDSSYEKNASLIFYDIINIHRQGIIPPKIRPSHQVLAMFNWESPATYDLNVMLGKNDSRWFNWFMTYRLDSDVHFPYGQFEKRQVELRELKPEPTMEQVKRKNKLAAWIVSNCKTGGEREKLVQELGKYMDIDIYGRCGKNSKKCPPRPANCRTLIEKDYKFYLSFENSLCLDYVTEKFFDAFSHNMVPIVYGLANYSEIAPPHSYINVFDFKTIEAFADYIHFLDNHPDEYLKYFEWKKTHVLKPSSEIRTKNLCSVCVKLYENESKIKELPNRDYVDWWNRPGNTKRISLHLKNITLNQSACVKPDEILPELKNITLVDWK